jgi:hypothetical protein
MTLLRRWAGLGWAEALGVLELGMSCMGVLALSG